MGGNRIVGGVCICLARVLADHRIVQRQADCLEGVPTPGHGKGEGPSLLGGAGASKASGVPTGTSGLTGTMRFIEKFLVQKSKMRVSLRICKFINR